MLDITFMVKYFIYRDTSEKTLINPTRPSLLKHPSSWSSFIQIRLIVWRACVLYNAHHTHMFVVGDCSGFTNLIATTIIRHITPEEKVSLIDLITNTSDILLTLQSKSFFKFLNPWRNSEQGEDNIWQIGRVKNSMRTLNITDFALIHRKTVRINEKIVQKL